SCGCATPASDAAPGAGRAATACAASTHGRTTRAYRSAGSPDRGAARTHGPTGTSGGNDGACCAQATGCADPTTFASEGHAISGAAASGRQAIAAYFDPGPNARPCAANSNGASDAVACRKPDHAAASRRVTDTSGWHSRSDDGSYLAAASRRVADTSGWH